MARALLTVMFTDMVGSTELRSRVGDEEVDRLVAIHDRIVDDAAGSHGGTVVKFLGDGALVTFPSAVDATVAAMEIQAALVDGPAIRIGIHAGDVEASDDDIAGLPVAIASRLCGIAPDGGVVVSGVVRSLAGSRSDMRFDSLGTPALRGVTESVEAWLATVGTEAAAPSADRLAAPSLGRSRGRFVGRLDALDRLNEALHQIGRQHLIAVSGEPGIGKTALVGHWARRIHTDGATVLVGSAPPEGVAPYQPFIEAIRPLLRLDPSLSPRGPGAANLARLMPELATASTGPPLLDDPRTERYVINEAFVEVLRKAVERHAPLVVILDDLHWADEASIVLLGHILRHADDVPVLLVGTYRDTDLDRRHPLADLLRDQRRERRADRVDITGLGVADVASLVEAVAGGSAPDATLNVIFSETEGNPFFVEEIIEHLLAEGLVVDGSWDFDPSAPLAIPEGIRDTIGRRLDRLSDDAQALLAAAAVVGASFDVDILVDVLDTPVETAENALEEALAAGFVAEQDATTLAFAHALIRQTILDELSHLRRARLHRRAGAALAAADAPPERLVHHWLEARDLPRALRASFEAMCDAEAVAAQSAVIQHATTVLELWDEVGPDDLPAGAAKHDAVVAAGLAMGISRGGQDGVEFLRTQRQTLEADGDLTGVGVVLTEEARHLWPLGRVDEALAAAERAIDLIPPDPPTSERARAEAQLGRLLMLNGRDMERAVEVARRALVTAQTAGDPHTETAVLATLGTLETDPIESENMLRKGLEMATAQNAAFQVTRARSNLAELLSGQGRYDEAISVMQEGFDQAERFGIQGQSLEWLRVNLAEKYFDSGRWDEAMSMLERGTSGGYPDAIRLSLISQIETHRGNLDSALSAYTELAESYGHITDAQSRSPLARIPMWIARWTGDTSGIDQEIFELTLTDAGHTAGTWWAVTAYLVAAPEVTAWASKTFGQRLVEVERFDTWADAAELILVGSGEGVRATLRAQRARFLGNDRPDLWAEAVEAWEEDSFNRAVATLGWLLASKDRSDESLRAAAARAIATAERLRAEPLLGELREAAAE